MKNQAHGQTYKQNWRGLIIGRKRHKKRTKKVEKKDNRPKGSIDKIRDVVLGNQTDKRRENKIKQKVDKGAA